MADLPQASGFRLRAPGFEHQVSSSDPRPPASGLRSPASSLYGCLCRLPSQAASVGAPLGAALTEIAEAFSPRYERHHDDLVTIDLRGLDRLFGTPRAIGEEMRREAASRGVAVRVAVAATRTTALVMALARPGLTVVAAGGEAGMLASVPLGLLVRMDAAAAIAPRAMSAVSNAADAVAFVAGLQHWGVRTLGELAALPPAELAARTGTPGRAWQGIARGEDARPLVPTRLEERFESSMALEWPIEGLEPLSFVLTRLLEPLSTRLERCDRGAAALHVALQLVTRTLHARRLELPAPMREVRALRTLALLDLESHPPGAAIDRVTITIDPTPARILQHTLFARPYPTPEQMSTLLARLGALMGQDRIGAAVPVDSHRPGAFAMKPFAIESAVARARSSASVGGTSPPCVVSALRRYRQPLPARVVVGADRRPVRVTTDRPGWGGGVVTSCAGPWRSSGAWWEEGAGRAGTAGEAGRAGGAGRASTAGEAGAWDRDQWDVALGDDAMYRIFQDRTTHAWFIDAIVD